MCSIFLIKKEGESRGGKKGEMRNHTHTHTQINNRVKNEFKYITDVLNKVYSINIGNVNDTEKMDPVDFIGYTRVRRKHEDIWIGPSVYFNKNAIPYHPGCCPTYKHIQNAKQEISFKGLNIHIEHQDHLPRFGYVTTIEVINGYTKDPQTFQSLKFGGKVSQHVKNKLLRDIYKVTSLYDLGWSLQYTIIWKNKVINSVNHRAIDYITLKEVSLTKDPRFMDCYTIIEGSKQDVVKNNMTKVFSVPVKQSNLKLDLKKMYFSYYKFNDEGDETSLFK